MLEKMLSTKRIIALLLTVVFCFLAVTGKVTAEQFLTVFSIVVAFYFGQSTARQAVAEAYPKAIPKLVKDIEPNVNYDSTKPITQTMPTSNVQKEDNDENPPNINSST